MMNSKAINQWLVFAACVGLSACGQEVDLVTAESTPLLHTLEVGEGNSIGFYEFAPGFVGISGVMRIDSLEQFQPQEVEGAASLSEAFARLAPNEPIPLALELADDRVREHQGKELDLEQLRPLIDEPLAEVDEPLAEGSPRRVQQAAILCSPDLSDDHYGQTWFNQTFYVASSMPQKSIQFYVARQVYYVQGPFSEVNAITYSGDHWYGHTHELHLKNYSNGALTLLSRVHVPPRSYAFSVLYNAGAGWGIRNGTDGPCAHNHMSTQYRP